jgi:hypothetical protein
MSKKAASSASKKGRDAVPLLGVKPIKRGAACHWDPVSQAAAMAAAQEAPCLII